MAIQNKLGRVQGAGVFVTTAEAYLGSNYQYVSRSDIFPTPENGVKPLLGDCIIFANGVVGTVSNVQSSSTIGCKTNLFSLKGKDGLNITKVEQTTTSTQSGGINVVTFTLSDGSKHNVQIANGQEGGSGVDGLVVKNENDQNKLYLTKEGQTVGTGITFPEGNGGGAGGTNFIANSNFSVNQRGKQIYDEQGTGRVYTLDRWAKNSATGNLVVEKIEGGSGGGSAVPNDGTFVENIYFNTSLSVDEVKAICNSIDGWVDLSDNQDGSLLIYYVAISEDMSAMLGIVKVGNDFMINCIIGDQEIAPWQSMPFMGETIGWQGMDVYPFNGNAVDGAALEAPFVVGLENDKLANLFSTTTSFGSGDSEKVCVSGTVTGRGEIFVQPVEGALLAGQTVAFSMQIPSLSGECMVGIVSKQGNTQTETYLAAKQGLNTLSCTIPANANQVVCGLFYTGDNQTVLSAKVAWAKLEVGKKATQYVPPLPAMDMAECQRFFQKADYNGAVGLAKSENLLEVTLPLPTTMRKTPSVNDTAKLYINNAHSLATPSVTKAGNNCVSLSFATQNVIANNFYVLNDYTGFFDAELYENE